MQLTSESGKSRLELLRRKAKADQIRPSWIANVRSACKVQLHDDDFLNVEQTMALKKRFFDLVKSSSDASHKEWPKEADPQVEALLKRVGEVFGEKLVVLFNSLDEYMGAARIAAKPVLVNYKKTWEIVGEDFSIATEDLRSGLCLEENFYTDDGIYVKEGVYKLTSWGALSLL